MNPELELWFMLALALGGRTVRELQMAMSGDEFVLWSAFRELRPFGPTRSSTHARKVLPQRPPGEVYAEFKVALLTYAGATHVR